ncbi:hypothetical protein BDQ17DRAFT_1370166 [Cyathus striatus]|nr:hypothetical protein BDQ17DRAFT_1370166 [Cyathus striatus]
MCIQRRNSRNHNRNTCSSPPSIPRTLVQLPPSPYAVCEFSAFMPLPQNPSQTPHTPSPLLTPFNASRPPQTTTISVSLVPRHQWASKFNMHDKFNSELPKHPTSTMRKDKPVMPVFDQRARMDGWYQGQTTESMEQLYEER